LISLVIAVALLLIHTLVCLVLWTLVKLGMLPVRGHMLPAMVLVPLWGPLLLVLCARGEAFGDALEDGTLESLRLNDEIRRGMQVQVREGDAGVVPLEEALIVNDPSDRRRLMLSMLTEDPDAYLAQLQAAKLNDDVEVAHYAATAVAQISKESDLKLQQLERAFKTDPSTENLDAYCDYLGTYLDSGLAEGRVEQIQRQQYARLLARRCEREDGAALRIRYATALADAGELDEAEAVITQLVAEVPDDQEAWMLCLRLAVMRRDGEGVRQVIDAIDNQHVYLSAENREQLAFWCDGGEAR
jgi:tetratricopeptide (TPR) repeat protein